MKTINIFAISLLLSLSNVSLAESLSAGGTSGVGGGGNSFNGTLIEGYSTDLQTDPKYSPVYLNGVVPLLKQFSDKIPVLGARIQNQMSSLTWYFVPTALKEISGIQTGIPFNSDQDAVQQYREIWVNTLNFDRRPTETQVQLLVHELVLAVLYDSPNMKIDQSIMRMVRVTTDLIMKSSELSDVEISNQLINIWRADLIKSRSEIEVEKRKKQETQLHSRNEELKLWPSYKPLISKVFSAFKSYCRAPTTQYVTDYTDWNDVASSSQKRSIIDNMLKLSTAVTPIALYSGIINIKYANQNDLSAAVVKKNSIIGPMRDYLWRDLATIFGDSYYGDIGPRRVLPWVQSVKKAGFSNGYEIEGYGTETVVNMYQECQEIETKKAQLNKQLPEPIF